MQAKVKYKLFRLKCEINLSLGKSVFIYISEKTAWRSPLKKITSRFFVKNRKHRD